MYQGGTGLRKISTIIPVELGKKSDHYGKLTSNIFITEFNCCISSTLPRDYNTCIHSMSFIGNDTNFMQRHELTSEAIEISNHCKKYEVALESVSMLSHT